jgi:hypothetical protein
MPSISLIVFMEIEKLWATVIELSLNITTLSLDLTKVIVSSAGSSI